MAEPISTTILLAFAVGIIIGILRSLSKKLMGIIWLIAVIIAISRIFILGPAGYAEGLNWRIWNWVAMFITVNISYLLGYSGMESFKEALN